MDMAELSLSFMQLVGVGLFILFVVILAVYLLGPRTRGG